MIPDLETDKVDNSDYSILSSQIIDFEKVFVAQETDSVEVINEQLA